MKLKYIIITVIVSFLFAGIGTIHAQGFYSNKTVTTEDTQTTAPGGLFRAEPGAGDGKTPDPGPDAPIGDGILILSLLSGAYTLIKRNERKKHED